MDKPGFKTSEFWLSLLVMVLGTLMASGVLSDGGMVAKIIGGVMNMLGVLGYTYARAKVKTVPHPEWSAEAKTGDHT